MQGRTVHRLVWVHLEPKMSWPALSTSAADRVQQASWVKYQRCPGYKGAGKSYFGKTPADLRYRKETLICT